MDIAPHQLNIEAARMLFSPALIAAAAAIWLVLTSGAAGHIVLRIEEITAGLRVPDPLPAPARGTAPDERHPASRPHPTCTRSLAEPQPVVRVDESEVSPEPVGSLLGPISLVPYLGIHPHTFELGAFRPSVNQARDELGLRRRHSFARAPDDDELAPIAARAPSSQRYRRAVTER